MTRDQIAADLLALVLRIANELPYEPTADDNPELLAIRQAEWHYLKGLASGQIMGLRDRVLGLSAASTLVDAAAQSGPSRYVGDDRQSDR